MQEGGLSIVGQDTGGTEATIDASTATGRTLVMIFLMYAAVPQAFRLERP